jgi:hypothetical protein
VVLLRKSNPQNHNLQTAVEHGVRACMGINSKTIRYAIWGIIFALCAILFCLDLNKNRYFSIPVEVFPISLASLLVVSAYLLCLENKRFKFFLWLGALASTLAFVWFILLYVAYPFGNEVTVLLYSLISYLIFWLFIKKENKP